MKWLNAYQAKTLNIFPEGKEPQSLIGQFQGLRYEEGVGRTLKVTIMITDTFGLAQALPIRPGNKVELLFTHPSAKEQFEFSAKKKNELLIANIAAESGNSKRHTYILECVTKTTMSNLTTRTIKRYKGKITDSVEKVLKDVLEVDSSRIDIPHPAMNEYSFTGNYNPPLKQVSRLASKCVGEMKGKSSAESGSAGYVLCEGERKGYSFFSIDKALQEDATYGYEQLAFFDSTKINNFAAVDTPRFVESHDIVKKLMVGQYKSANWYYNIIDRTPHFVEYSYKDSKLDSANEDQYIPNDIDEKYSRIFLNVLDVGAMAEKKAELKSTAETIAWRQAHATGRFQSLFSQSLELTVPMNLSLEVGMILKMSFPLLNTESPGMNPSSGNYMVSKLAHVFGDPRGDVTGISLVRDSFAFYSK